MSIKNYLSAEPLHEILKYSKFKRFSKDYVAFTGAPKKHPYDKEKLILITDPFSSHTNFFEFKIDDIEQVDDLPQIVAESGDSIKMVRIWVKKGSLGVRYEPFVVEDTLNILKDTAFFSNKRETE
ncbi:MAG: hypothetical protein JW904_12080 [Spirochaetales bacterium]|nr:hypothetical protein [Spirochaetales bacterium]